MKGMCGRESTKKKKQANNFRFSKEEEEVG